MEEKQRQSNIIQYFFVLKDTGGEKGDLMTQCPSVRHFDLLGISTQCPLLIIFLRYSIHGFTGDLLSLTGRIFPTGRLAINPSANELLQELSF